MYLVRIGRKLTGMKKGTGVGAITNRKEWRMCWVRVGEEGKSEGVRDKNRGLNRKHGR